MNHSCFDEGLKRWIMATAWKNHWRVAAWYDIEDLIQDGYLCYQKCANRYRWLANHRRPTKEHRKQFMSLVQRAYVNHITDLANKRTDQPERTVTSLNRSAVSNDAFLDAFTKFERAELTVQNLLDLLPLRERKLVEEALHKVTRTKGKLTPEEYRAMAEKLRAKISITARTHENSVDTISRIYDYAGSVRRKRRA